MSRFLRLESAIEVCTGHIEKVADPDPEIDTVLAGHIAAVAYAAFEKQIRQLVAARCAHPTDEPISRFTAEASVRLVRSIRVGELAGVLGLFGDAEKAAFQAKIKGEPEAVAAWDNLITGRQDVAHENGAAPTMTLTDIQRDVAAAERVIDVFEAALVHADCSGI